VYKSVDVEDVLGGIVTEYCSKYD